MDEKKKLEEARAFLRRVDDTRRTGMLKVWGWIGDSPQKAGWLALALVLIAFFLGRWSK